METNGGNGGSAAGRDEPMRSRIRAYLISTPRHRTAAWRFYRGSDGIILDNTQLFWDIRHALRSDVGRRRSAIGCRLSVLPWHRRLARDQERLITGETPVPRGNRPVFAARRSPVHPFTRSRRSAFGVRRSAFGVRRSPVARRLWSVACPL